MIFATGQHVEPYLTVYPDSDKVSGPGGILLRSSAVGYWHGEGTGEPSDPVEIEREPANSTPQPTVNLLAVRAGPGALLGGCQLEGTVVDMVPGEASGPYQYVFGREAWLLVLAGMPTLRHPDGDDQLEPGDLVCFPQGPAGARQLLNREGSVVRALHLSTTGLPAYVCYPDTGRWLIQNGPGQEDVTIRETGPVDAATARSVESDERGR